ncbi:Phosphoribosylformylglycinamidine synthase subunit PurQ [subsurface metagenome]
MAKLKSLVITGDGLNCEEETREAYKIVEAEPYLIHITDFLDGNANINDYHILNFIGGFANGDHLGAGTVQAVRFRHKLREQLQEYIDSGKLVIGICNGFQTIIKMGILPGMDGDYTSRTATLMTNDSGKFEDRWVYLKANKDSPCIWTKGIDNLFIPVRHGEGKFFTLEDELISRLFNDEQIVLQYSDKSFENPTMEYPLNPNGSLNAIAGICDSTGRIFGLMPHPEAYLYPYNHPSWARDVSLGKKLQKEGQGVQVFRNAVEYVKQS